MAIKFNHTGAGDIVLSSDAASTLKVDGYKVWHENNDGTGSLLDADLLDGAEGSAYAKLASAETVTGNWTITGNHTFKMDTIGDHVFWRNGTTGASGLAFRNDDGIKGYLGFDDNSQFTIWNASTSPKLTIDASGNLIADGDITGATVASITAANLLDKSATESISGAWTFTNTTPTVFQKGAQLNDGAAITTDADLITPVGTQGVVRSYVSTTGATNLPSAAGVWLQVDRVVTGSGSASGAFRLFQANSATPDLRYAVWDNTGATWVWDTVALATDLSGYLPLTGGALTGALSSTGIFTSTAVASLAAPNFLASNSGPAFGWYETDGAADEKAWQIAASAGQLKLRLINDALNTSSNIMTVDRTGTTIDNVTFWARVYFTGGNAGTPGLAFSSEPTTGIYRAAAGQIAVSVLGTNELTINQTTATFAGAINVDGAVLPTTTATHALGNTSFRWSQVFSTGFYAEDGTNQVYINATGLYSDRATSYIRNTAVAGAWYMDSELGTVIRDYNGGSATNIIELLSSGSKIYTNLNPDTTNSRALGTTALRYSNIFANALQGTDGTDTCYISASGIFGNRTASYLRNTNASGAWYIEADGAIYFRDYAAGTPVSLFTIASGQITSYKSIVPDTTASYNLGTTASNWNNAYLAASLHLGYSATALYSTLDSTNGWAWRPHTTSGGWARGMTVVRQSDTARVAGAGWLGSAEALSGFYIGFGTNWWSTDNAFTLTAGGDITNKGVMTLDRQSGTTVYLGFRNLGAQWSYVGSSVTSVGFWDSAGAWKFSVATASGDTSIYGHLLTTGTATGNIGSSGNRFNVIYGSSLDLTGAIVTGGTLSFLGQGITDFGSTLVDLQKEVGFFSAGFQATDYPAGANYWSGVEFKHNIGTDYRTQIATGTTDGAFAVRYKINGTWGSWHDVWQSGLNNLPRANNSFTLGSDTFRFSGVYATAFYEAGTALSSKYLAKTGGTLTGSITVNAGVPWVGLYENDQGTDEKYWLTIVDGKKVTIRAYDDALSGSKIAWGATRGTGTAIGTIEYGNSTDYPVHYWYGVKQHYAAGSHISFYEYDAADALDRGMIEVNSNALSLYGYDNSAATWRQFLSGNITTGQVNLASGTTIGGTAVSLSGHTHVYADLPGLASGNWYGGIPYVGNDGVMEIGRYLDFHESDAGVTDYETRLSSNSGHLTCSGALIASSGITWTTASWNAGLKISSTVPAIHLRASASSNWGIGNSTNLYFFHSTSDGVDQAANYVAYCTPAGAWTIPGTVTANGYEVGWRRVVQEVAAGKTLVVGDAGKSVHSSSTITVNSGIFSAGDIITVTNSTASAITISQGASVTLRLAGTATTGSRTLAGYGVANIFCVASNTFYVSGAGVS
jgi:hypothetical protein